MARLRQSSETLWNDDDEIVRTLGTNSNIRRSATIFMITKKVINKNSQTNAAVALLLSCRDVTHHRWKMNVCKSLHAHDVGLLPLESFATFIYTLNYITVFTAFQTMKFDSFYLLLCTHCFYVVRLAHIGAQPHSHSRLRVSSKSAFFCFFENKLL